MSPYPDLPGPRTHALVRDLLTLALLALFIWLGVRVHSDVARLARVGGGISAAGSAVQGGFRTAATAARNVPVVGDTLAGVLQSASGATGGNLSAIGRQSSADARHLAVLLGLTSWAVPTLFLLGLVVPRRAREVRRLRELRLALRAPGADARRRLIAARALGTVPEDILFAFSADPAEDLRSGRYEPLFAAALHAEGLSPSENLHSEPWT